MVFYEYFLFDSNEFYTMTKISKKFIQLLIFQFVIFNVFFNRFFFVYFLYYIYYLYFNFKFTGPKAKKMKPDLQNVSTNA